MKEVNELRERLVEVWAGLQQNVTDDAIDQWRRRLLINLAYYCGGRKDTFTPRGFSIAGPSAPVAPAVPTSLEESRVIKFSPSTASSTDDDATIAEAEMTEDKR